VVPTSSPANPGRLLRRVLSEERGGCCSPRLSCGYSRAMLRGTSHDWIRLVGLVFNIQDQRLRQGGGKFIHSREEECHCVNVNECSYE